MVSVKAVGRQPAGFLNGMEILLAKIEREINKITIREEARGEKTAAQRERRSQRMCFQY